MIAGRVARSVARFVYALVFVCLFAAVGKVCQYSAVSCLQPAMGFEVASAIGLIPFMAWLLFAKARAPAWFDWRSRQP